MRDCKQTDIAEEPCADGFVQRCHNCNNTAVAGETFIHVNQSSELVLPSIRMVHPMFTVDGIAMSRSGG